VGKSTGPLRGAPRGSRWGLAGPTTCRRGRDERHEVVRPRGMPARSSHVPSRSRGAPCQRPGGGGAPRGDRRSVGEEAPDDEHDGGDGATRRQSRDRTRPHATPDDRRPRGRGRARPRIRGHAPARCRRRGRGTHRARGVSTTPLSPPSPRPPPPRVVSPRAGAPVRDQVEGALHLLGDRPAGQIEVSMGAMVWTRRLASPGVEAWSVDSEPSWPVVIAVAKARCSLWPPAPSGGRLWIEPATREWDGRAV
jgi:hypothetical protein